MQDTLAWILYLRGDAERAATLVTEAVRGAPDHAELRMHAAFVHQARGAHAVARFELAAALRLDPPLREREEVRALYEQLTTGVTAGGVRSRPRRRDQPLSAPE